MKVQPQRSPDRSDVVKFRSQNGFGLRPSAHIALLAGREAQNLDG